MKHLKHGSVQAKVVAFGIVFACSCNGGGGSSETPGSQSSSSSQAPSIHLGSNLIATKGIAITGVVPTNSGGTITSCVSSPPLPVGLNLSSSCVIFGSPSTILATTVYSVTGTNSFGSGTATISIAVNDAAPTNLLYSNGTVTYAAGIPISNNSPSNSGGAIVSYSVSPALPSGLLLNSITGIINGTPSSVSQSAHYIITATNSGGSTSSTLTITVTDPVSILNLHDHQRVETGFITGSAMSGVIQVGCQFDGGTVQTAMGTSKWSCSLPSGLNTWRQGTQHIISVGSKSGASIVQPVTISVTKGNNHDINGDGYPDLVVAAQAFNNTTGAVYIFYGGPNGIAASPNTTLMGVAIHQLFGTSLVLADFNGDGYADLAVGAVNITNSANDGVYIYNGSSSGVSASPSKSISPPGSSSDFGWSLAAGDLNGDGYSDLAVGDYGGGKVYLFSGSSTGVPLSPSATIISPSANEGFGYSMAIGDLNGDSYADLIVGALNGVQGNRGAVYTYHGSSGGLGANPNTTMTQSLNGEYFGATVAVGDLNGDGNADIVVGSGSGGNIYVYLSTGSGAPTSATSVLGFLSGNSWWNSGLAIGDVNGDGYDDIAVSEPHGQVSVFDGSSLGVATTPTFVLNSPANGFLFSGLGDFNGDGYADLVAGYPSYNGSSGVVYLYDGLISGPVSSPSTTINAPTAGEQFGDVMAH